MPRRSRFAEAMTGYGMALTAFLLARRWLRDRDWPPVALLNSLLHLPLLPMPALVGLAVLGRRWRMAAALMAPAAEFARAYGPPLLRLFKRPEPTAGSFGLLTYNLHKEQVYLEPMADLIREAGAEVIAFQELSATAAAYFAAAFAQTHPYTAMHPHAGYPSAGQGLLSRFPIREDEYWQNPDIPNALGNQCARLEIGGQAITLYNAHPVHPGMVGRMFDARPRDVEISRLLARIRSTDGPVVLVGDMNLTDQSDDYRRLVGVLRDAYAEAGRGLAFTYPDWHEPHSRSVIGNAPLPFAPPPLLRLDYVFVRGPVRVREVHAMPHSGGSDHRPTFARLAVVP